MGWPKEDVQSNYAKNKTPWAGKRKMYMPSNYAKNKTPWAGKMKMYRAIMLRIKHHGLAKVRCTKHLLCNKNKLGSHIHTP